MKAIAIRTGLAAALMALGVMAGAATSEPMPPNAVAANAAASAARQVPPAVEAAVRKNLAMRMPNIPKIDEINTTPVPGLYEVRIGTELFYSDADAGYIINGSLMDTRAKRNLTEERQEKLLAFAFDELQMKDAFTIVRGNGKRKLAVFEDPNCGYCKRFEHDLQKVDNVTVYMFLYPILGPDSLLKSRAHWCAKDKGQAWQDWMLRSEPVKGDATCDLTALNRNLEFGKKHKISGTPTLIFTDGSRIPGAIGTAEIEKMLAAK